MDPSDFPIPPVGLPDLALFTEPAPRLSTNDLLARALRAYPSRNFGDWLPQPPSQEAAARADPLTQLGLSQTWPDLFGHLAAPEANLADLGQLPFAPACPPPIDGAAEHQWQTDPYAAFGIAPPNALRRVLPSADLAQTYTARPGDSISAILGSSDPKAIGQFALQNGLQSSAIRKGHAYVVPHPSQQLDAHALATGQAILDRDNARVAHIAGRLPPPPSRGLWVDGKYYPADRLFEAAAALSGPALDGPPPASTGSVLLGGVPPPTFQDIPPEPRRSWLQNAQREFWRTVSDHTAENAGDFFGRLAQEVWNDLPGLDPALGYLPAISGAPIAGRALFDAEPSAAVAESYAVPIGRSGFRSIEELHDAVLAKYQALYDHHYASELQLAERGVSSLSPFALGRRVDDLTRVGMRDWLKYEGILEGPTGMVRINRRLYEPIGSGAFRRPDIYIPEVNSVLDGSLGAKTSSMDQIADFGRFSGGAKTTIIRPSGMAAGKIAVSDPQALVGSYGIIN